MTGAEKRELRRQNFAYGREMLINKGVPFEPNDLLRDDWKERLGPFLKAMPEMQEVRRHNGPLKGAQFAETLYFPEFTELTGDAVIVCHSLVFEGKRPVIRGNHNISIFQMEPTIILGSTVAELGLGARVLDSSLGIGVRGSLPQGHTLLQMGVNIRGTITIDVSGTAPLRQPVKRNAAYLVASAYRASQDENADGTSGVSGTNGAEGVSGLNGQANGTSPDGSCPNSPSGVNGVIGQDGTSGGNGGSGGPGQAGTDAGSIDAEILDGDTSFHIYSAKGGNGGYGGNGGRGGSAGSGGHGGSGGNGVTCGCLVGSGGSAAIGGAGARGGDGGNGGQGGDGGRGGTITISVPASGASYSTNVNGGVGGPGGAGGSGGVGGLGGAPGTRGGPGPSACGNSGIYGFPTSFGSAGAAGDSGGAGAPGATGQIGTWEANPRTTSGGCECDTCGECTRNCGCSPIVLSIALSSKYELTSAAGGVPFDLDANGEIAGLVGWTPVDSSVGFLVLDRNQNGVVDDGSELFGNHMPVPGGYAANGFAALAYFDMSQNGGNDDKWVDAQDSVWKNLRIWVDANHDGISQPGELHQLEDVGITRISVRYGDERRRDRFGNLFRYRGEFVFNGKIRNGYDVYFSTARAPLTPK